MRKSQIPFVKGVDCSTLLELEQLGVKYYNRQGKEEELLSILKENDINYIRLRLWNDPYSEEGQPYGAGTNDLGTTIALAKRALALNMGVLLDLHYSDFWADPGKQRKPKAWSGYTTEQLINAVEDYTGQVLRSMKEHHAFPTMVQVGNELSNGLLWPEGKVPEYENIAKLVSAGIRAVRKADPELPVMIHLDNGGNNELYREWFDHYQENGGEDFDIIGLSYYPFWHGTMQQLTDNMKDIAVRYGKELIVAEVSMGFSMEDYGAYEGLKPEERKGMATRKELVENIEFPMTPEGQKAFMERLLQKLESVPEHRGRGFFYWEAGWIPVRGSGWATPAALDYIKEKGPCGNEWANQALFDYEGHALPALETIRNYVPIK